MTNGLALIQAEFAMQVMRLLQQSHAAPPSK
jgi:hypothetical protein